MARGAVAVRRVAPCATWVSTGAVQYGGEVRHGVPAPVFGVGRVSLMRLLGGCSVVS